MKINFGFSPSAFFSTFFLHVFVLNTVAFSFLALVNLRVVALQVSPIRDFFLLGLLASRLEAVMSHSPSRIFLSFSSPIREPVLSLPVYKYFLFFFP